MSSRPLDYPLFLNLRFLAQHLLAPLVFALRKWQIDNRSVSSQESSCGNNVATIVSGHSINLDTVAKF